MRVGVLGTGNVGQTLASKLISLGEQVMMGARRSGNEKAVAWVKEAGPLASQGSFADAVRFGEIVVNATAGIASLEALRVAGTDNLSDKIVVDVTNPLDFSRGRPPTLSVCNTESLGEQIQKAFPNTRVVKALNTVNFQVMVDPGLVPGSHTIFLCGNDAEAKRQVMGLLERFGWPAEEILDLGDISNSRGTEMYMPLWMRIRAAVGTNYFNIEVVKS